MSSLTDHGAQLEQFDRVRHMSTDNANRAIDASIRESIERATAGGRAPIEERLAALQGEWDIDRVLMVNFVALSSRNSSWPREIAGGSAVRWCRRPP